VVHLAVLDTEKIRDNQTMIDGGVEQKSKRKLLCDVAALVAYASVINTGLAIAAKPAAGASSRTILVYGDSLSAAYGLNPTQGWVHLLSERLKAEKFDWQVVNASISGETTAGGVARLARTLAEHRPKIVLLELGANDGLRGLPIATMRNNLNAMVKEIRAAGATAVIVGMQIPPNYGLDYARDFSRTFENLAREQKLPLVPFLLEGIADKRDLFLPDNLHPNAIAQPKVLANVWPPLVAALKSQKP
jgi:acyl-CoA thioesterase I